MNKSNPFRHLAMTCFACLLASSCGDKKDYGNTLPDGKYPMTFTTSVEGFTVPNPVPHGATGNVWDGGEKIALQVGGEVKEYTAAADGKLAVSSGGTPFYWHDQAETKSVSAWHLGDGSAASGQLHAANVPASWAVQSDQSKIDADNTADNYQRSEFLCAPATDISFKNRNSTTLTFHHQTSLVVINIVKAEAATDAAAIRSVAIGDAGNLALSGSYTAPTGTGVTAGTWDTSSGNLTMGTITPKKLDTPGTLFGGGTALASYAALVIPQQMQNKKFIAVSLTDGNTYYYTPIQDSVANLQSGKQHTYDVTVKHGYLEVRTADGGSAGGDGNGEDVTGKTPADGYSAADLKIGDYYYSDGKSSDGGNRKYSDGSTAIMPVDPVLTDADGKPRTVVGIVFWVGDATAKDRTLQADHPGCTHGLVVALKDVVDGETAWQTPSVSVQDWLNSNKNGEFLNVNSTLASSAPLNNIQGLNNTKAIEAFNAANPGNKVQAVERVVAYRGQVKAPGTSSDWYLPSEKELTLLCGQEVDDIWNNNSGGTGNRDLINGKLSSISDAAQILSAEYWSSTESSNYNALCMTFSSGHVISFYKSFTYRVRCVLAF